MKMTLKTFLPLLACVLVGSALAQRADLVSVRNEAQQLRRELAREPLRRAAPESLALAAPGGVLTTVSAGVSHTDGHDYRAWNTPLGLAFTFPSGWRASISTAGYEWDKLPGDDASGWTDVKFKAGYAAPVGGGTLSGGLAVRMPAKGDVGSRHWQQEISLGYRATRGSLTCSVAGAVKHNAGDQPPGVSAYPKYGAASLTHDLGGDKSVSVQLDRLYVPGKGGLSTAGGSYDFPLKVASRDVAATLSLSKGISSADRSTTVGLDLSYQF